jgi:hypothetical protein
MVLDFLMVWLYCRRGPVLQGPRTHLTVVLAILQKQWAGYLMASRMCLGSLEQACWSYFCRLNHTALSCTMCHLCALATTRNARLQPTRKW